MAIKADRWIREMAETRRMIEPFSGSQVAEGMISYGLSSYGYDLPSFKTMYDLDTWKKVEPPVGTVYGYPPRADEETSIAGAPARSEVGAQIYNQAINTVMVSKVTQGDEKIDDVIKWAENELEGTLRA